MFPPVGMTRASVLKFSRERFDRTAPSACIGG
jgi:hypothetical protein